MVLDGGQRGAVQVGVAEHAAIAGLLHIARANDFALIDVQMQSPHVMRFGATLMEPDEFAAALADALG